MLSKSVFTQNYLFFVVLLHIFTITDLVSLLILISVLVSGLKKDKSHIFQHPDDWLQFLWTPLYSHSLNVHTWMDFFHSCVSKFTTVSFIIKIQTVAQSHAFDLEFYYVPVISQYCICIKIMLIMQTHTTLSVPAVHHRNTTAQRSQSVKEGENG